MMSSKNVMNHSNNGSSATAANAAGATTTKPLPAASPLATAEGEATDFFSRLQTAHHQRSGQLQPTGIDRRTAIARRAVLIPAH